MKARLLKRFIFIFLLFAGGIAARAQIQATQSVVTLDPNVTFQTIVGWEATAQAGQQDSLAFANYKDELYDRAVNDLGINRLRVEIKNPGGTSFDLVTLDNDISSVVVPLKQRLEARGEKLFVNVCYVGFKSPSLANDPITYAQNVLSTYQHMQGKFGFVPNAWEIILEPDNANWSGTQIGNALVAAANLLKDHGFQPSFIAPSSTNMANAILQFDEVMRVPGAQTYLAELSYHRYSGVSNGNLQAIADRATQFGIRSAMLEHINADYNELHQDLKLGRNSAWQQFTLAYPTDDNGAQYYWIDDQDAAHPQINLGKQTRFLRQYFKYVRSGAKGINATSTDNNFDPVAFVNVDGKYVVVVKAASGGNFSIKGLAAGIYGIKYTTNSQYDVDSADVQLAAGEMLSANIPETGVITIYAKSVVAPPSPSPSSTLLSPTVTSTPISGNPNLCFSGLIFLVIPLVVRIHGS